MWISNVPFKKVSLSSMAKTGSPNDFEKWISRTLYVIPLGDLQKPLHVKTKSFRLTITIFVNPIFTGNMGHDRV
jgi:hypothetical protein